MNIFELQDIFFNKCKWPQNYLEHYKVKDVLKMSPDHKFHCFALQPGVFELQPFWDMYTEWHQNDLEKYQVTDTGVCPWVPHFTSFCSVTIAVFEVQAILRNFTKWPQMTMGITGLMVPHTGVTKVTESLEISLCFLTGHLRQMCQIIPEMTDLYKVKGTPYMFY